MDDWSLWYAIQTYMSHSCNAQTGYSAIKRGWTMNTGNCTHKSKCIVPAKSIKRTCYESTISRSVWERPKMPEQKTEHYMQGTGGMEGSTRLGWEVTSRDGKYVTRRYAFIKTQNCTVEIVNATICKVRLGAAEVAWWLNNNGCSCRGPGFCSQHP